MFTNDIIGSSRSEHGDIDDKQVRLFAEGLPALKEMPESLRALISTGGESDSISRQLARHVKEMGERYVPGFTVSIIHRRDRYLRGGDHIPFLERGYAALRFTEPNEDFNHQHQDVRVEKGMQMGDLPEFVDFQYTSNVARVNAAALATLALAPAAPTNVRVKITQLENDTNLVWDANREPDLAGYRVVWRDDRQRLAGRDLCRQCDRARLRASPRTTISLGCRRGCGRQREMWRPILCRQDSGAACCPAALSSATG